MNTKLTTANAGYRNVISFTNPICDIGIAMRIIKTMDFLYEILNNSSKFLPTLYILETSVENISSQIINKSKI